MFQKDQTGKEKSRAAGDLDNKQAKITPRKCFRCGSEDHLNSKSLKPPKENKKRLNQVSFNEKVNRACNNSKNNSDQKIYAYIWHVCLVMMNVLVEMFVTVQN